jgi:transposase
VFTAGIHDVYLAEGSVNGDEVVRFVEESPLSVLYPFNASPACIHHVDLIEEQVGAKLCYLPLYSPDPNPVETCVQLGEVNDERKP